MFPPTFRQVQICPNCLGEIQICPKHMPKSEIIFPYPAKSCPNAGKMSPQYCTTLPKFKYNVAQKF